MTDCDPNATRRIPLEFDEQGNPMFSSVCSPESFKQRALCVTPPRHVIPVIFVPGIMGSNLKANKTAEKPGGVAWRPPNGAREGVKEVWGRAGQEPAERQKQLNPDRVEVDTGGTVEIPQTLYTLTKKEAKRRGWGEVHWGGYGKALTFLEEALNDQYESCGTKHAQEMPVWKLAQDIKEKTVKRWGPKGDAHNLNRDEFLRLDDYYYPVWACGYNWMVSNDESAKRLLHRIDDVLAYYTNSQYFIPEGRVILVSHSMGGLVTRRAAQQSPEKIIGIVHGEQPVLGAPVVYRRFRAGTENDGFFDIIGKMSAIVLGWDAADTTCVLAHSPGALELLPTKDYPKEWLKIQHGEEVLASLPKADPYSEIYATKVQDVWWGMIDETLIDPAGLVEKGKSPFTAYDEALTKAKDFHDQLGLYFHPNTYAHFGADKKDNSFHTVRWQAVPRPESDLTKLIGQPAESLMKTNAETWTRRGECEVLFQDSHRHFRLAGKDGGGDATVPEPSGAIVEQKGLKATFRMQGFVHADSYNNAHVLDNTCYCIARIVQDAKPVKDLPQSKKENPVCTTESDTSQNADSSSSSSAGMQPDAQKVAVL